MMVDEQGTGGFVELNEDQPSRDQEIQASVWALLFLVGELSLAFRTLRDVLHQRGALQPEDEEAINQMAANEERVRVAYEHVERAFYEKYSKVVEAMLNPEEVNQRIQEHIREEEARKKASTTIRLQDKE